MKLNNPVLIVEHCTSGLSPMKESTQKKDYILGGVFTEFGIKNRNDRIYTADKFLPHLDELLERKKQLSVIYGEFDHPDVFDTSLARVSHTIESVTFNQQHNRVEGEIRLLNTHWGKEAKALVDDGCPIFVSSRAAGITESNGEVTVKKLFTYDAVADPGFGSAKMEIRSLNESLGFNESANFRIYDLSDESKFNDLIMDNKNNQFVTKEQMVEYSTYLTDQIESLSKALSTDINGKDKGQILEMSELLENLHTQQSQVQQYLDYLAEKVQIVANENVSLKKETSKLTQHNDYLAENLERSINYSNYLAEKLDKNISYSEYIAENLDKSIDYSDYLAENVEKTIEYSDYLAENLEKSIDYSEYIAENLDKNIAYSEYIAENLDKSIDYSEYVAENLDGSIAYSEYLAENLDNNIAYSEYIAEHVDNNIAYSEYIAENVSDVQAYGNYIAESLDKTIDAIKENKLFEQDGQTQPQLDYKVDDVQQYYNDEEKSQVVQPTGDVNVQTGANAQAQENPAQPTVDGQPIQGEEIQGEGEIQVEAEPGSDVEINVDVEGTEEPSEEGQPVAQEIVQGMNVAIGNETGQVRAYDPVDRLAIVKLDGTGEEVSVTESKLTIISGNIEDNETKISESIAKLITETKKRKASEDQEPHFFQFLTEKNRQLFNDLSAEDKEKVTFAINESKYYNESDVMKIMNEALTVKKSFEEELVENLPSDLRPVYESLEDKYKTSLFAQAKLYPNLNTSSRMEAFWRSRELEKYTKVKENKQVLNESKLIDNTKLSDSEVNAILGKIKNS